MHPVTLWFNLWIHSPGRGLPQIQLISSVRILIQFTCYTPIHGYSLLVILRYMDTVYSLYSDTWIQFTRLTPIHGYSLLVILRYMDTVYSLYSDTWIQFTRLLRYMDTVYSVYSNTWIQFTHYTPIHWYWIQNRAVSGAPITDRTRSTSSRSSGHRQYKNY